MSTALTCGGCNVSPYPVAKPLNSTFTGSEVYLIPDASTGLTTLNIDFPLGCCVVTTNSTTRKILITAGGYTADNVGNTGSGHSDTLYTVGAATVVGSISSTSTNLTLTITFPSALADNLAISLSYYDSCHATAVPAITVARNFTADPCKGVSFTPTALKYFWNADICAYDFCGGDKPAIYADGEAIAGFDETGKLVPFEGSTFAVTGWIDVQGGNPSACNCVNAYSVHVGAAPGISASVVLTYRNGSEIVYLSPCTQVCSYTFDFTGIDVTNPVIVSGLLVDGVQQFGGRPSISVTAISVAALMPVLATALTAQLGLGTWTSTATTVVLLSPRTLGAMTGTDGSGTPGAAFSKSPTQSC